MPSFSPDNTYNIFLPYKENNLLQSDPWLSFDRGNHHMEEEQGARGRVWAQPPQIFPHVAGHTDMHWTDSSFHLFLHISQPLSIWEGNFW